MQGGRELYTCPKCKKKFNYWLPEGTAMPKLKCSFCRTETYPNGKPPDPPPAPPKTAPPKTAPPKLDAPKPDAPKPDAPKPDAPAPVS